MIYRFTCTPVSLQNSKPVSPGSHLHVHQSHCKILNQSVRAHLCPNTVKSCGGSCKYSLGPYYSSLNESVCTPVSLQNPKLVSLGMYTSFIADPKAVSQGLPLPIYCNVLQVLIRTLLCSSNN